jgi:hypothetical protein
MYTASAGEAASRVPAAGALPVPEVAPSGSDMQVEPLDRRRWWIRHELANAILACLEIFLHESGQTITSIEARAVPFCRRLGIENPCPPWSCARSALRGRACEPLNVVLGRGLSGGGRPTLRLVMISMRPGQLLGQLPQHGGSRAQGGAEPVIAFRCPNGETPVCLAAIKSCRDVLDVKVVLLQELVR